jgi:hypothetical protein
MATSAVSEQVVLLEEVVEQGPSSRRLPACVGRKAAAAVVMLAAAVLAGVAAAVMFRDGKTAARARGAPSSASPTGPFLGLQQWQKDCYCDCDWADEDSCPQNDHGNQNCCFTHCCGQVWEARQTTAAPAESKHEQLAQEKPDDEKEQKSDELSEKPDKEGNHTRPEAAGGRNLFWTIFR